MRRVFMRIDPQAVIVAVRNVHFVEQMAAVGRFVSVHIHDVEHVLVARVGDDVHVVPRPLPQAVARIHQLPRLAAVVGAIKSAVRIVSFDQRINAIGVRGDRYANFPVWSFGQAVLFNVLPGRAAVV